MEENFVKRQVRLSQIRSMSDLLKDSLNPDPFNIWRMFLKRLIANNNKSLGELVIDETMYSIINDEFLSILEKGNWRC